MRWDDCGGLIVAESQQYAGNWQQQPGQGAQQYYAPPPQGQQYPSQQFQAPQYGARPYAQQPYMQQPYMQQQPYQPGQQGPVYVQPNQGRGGQNDMMLACCAGAYFSAPR